MAWEARWFVLCANMLPVVAVIENGEGQEGCGCPDRSLGLLGRPSVVNVRLAARLVPRAPVIRHGHTSSSLKIGQTKHKPLSPRRRRTSRHPRTWRRLRVLRSRASERRASAMSSCSARPAPRLTPAWKGPRSHVLEWMRGNADSWLGGVRNEIGQHKGASDVKQQWPRHRQQHPQSEAPLTASRRVAPGPWPAETPTGTPGRQAGRAGQHGWPGAHCRDSRSLAPNAVLRPRERAR